jgi:hypothetical protein
MTISSIMICDIKPQYTAQYIANVLETREIASVSSITLIPEIKNDEICNIAYIDINKYCDTETAYECILYMKSGGFIFCHEESKPDDYWIIQKNTHNSGDLYVGTFTTKFHDNQSQKELPFEELPINMDYYSLYKEKINDYDNELHNEQLLQEAVNNSYYVTVRSHQYFDNKQGILSLIDHAVKNSFNVTLRPHQQDFKLLRCERSLSDLSV